MLLCCECDAVEKVKSELKIKFLARNKNLLKSLFTIDMKYLIFYAQTMNLNKCREHTQFW